MSTRIESGIFIRRPPQDVFAVLVDATQTATYVPGVQSVEMIDGAAPGVGARARTVLSRLGRPMEIVSVYTAYEPAKRIVLENDGGPIPFMQTTTLSAEEGGTRLHRVVEMSPEGFFAGIGVAVVRGSAERNLENEMATLKALLEHQGPAGGGDSG